MPIESMEQTMIAALGVHRRLWCTCGTARSESELGSARGRQRFEGTVGSEKASRSEYIVLVLCPRCPTVVLLGERMVCMVIAAMVWFSAR